MKKLGIIGAMTVEVALLKENMEKSVRLPMLPQIRSLNLSNSVAIAVYEVLRQWDFEGFCLEGHLTEEE